MRLKSYYVRTMEEALHAAKVELGDEAMLVDSKTIAGRAGSRASLEVIFASPVTPPPPPKVSAPAVPTVAPGSVAGLRRFRSELTTLLDALNRTPDATRLDPLSPARAQLDALRARLLEAELPVSLLDDTLRLCRPVLEGLALRGVADGEEMDQCLLPLLAADGPHPPEACAEGGRRVLVLTGPRGAGKTTAIAKLAFQWGLSEGRALSVISIDNLRVGGPDQLGRICSLLGVPFEALDDSAALRGALASRPPGAMILIDTPGYGSGDAEVMRETGAHLDCLEFLECHLVLPATMRYSEMKRQFREFAVFTPTRLLYTRWEETAFFGPAWAFARETRLPVEWLTKGPGIAEGLERADATRFAAGLLGRGADPVPFREKARAARAAAGTGRG